VSLKFPVSDSEPDAAFIQANNPPFPAANTSGYVGFINDLTVVLDECISSKVAGPDSLSDNASQSSDLPGRSGENPDSYVFVSQDEQSAGLIDTLEQYLQTLPNEYATHDVSRNAADNARRAGSEPGSIRSNR